MPRRGVVRAHERAGQLERDERSHAVPEEDERPIAERPDLAVEQRHQRAHLADRRLSDAVLSSRQLHRDHLDEAGQDLGPATEDGGATSGVVEAEEA